MSFGDVVKGRAAALRAVAMGNNARADRRLRKPVLALACGLWLRAGELDLSRFGQGVMDQGWYRLVVLAGAWCWLGWHLANECMVRWGNELVCAAMVVEAMMIVTVGTQARADALMWGAARRSAGRGVLRGRQADGAWRGRARGPP